MFNNDHDATCLVKLLRKPPLPPSPLIEIAKKRGLNPRATEDVRVRPLNLDQLPTELLFNIFDEIDDLSEALYLGFTCAYVWACGERRINELYCNFHAPWRNAQILCLGRHSRNIPKNCLETDIVKDFLQTSIEHRDPFEDEQLSRNLISHIWSNCATQGSLVCRPRFAGSGLSKAEFHLFSGYLYPMFDTHLREGPLILRNISKMLYVRADTLSVRREGNLAPGLGKALFARISWSSCQHGTIDSPDVRVSHGEWAGDRFDVVSLKVLGGSWSTLDDNGWRDATDNVRDDLISLWIEEYGPEWEAKAW
ncbi:hypothetical protein DL93DRAFT_2162827 [Clavulina sp. PMI_390]|nr:hypothetical protein DL93DRAFT_2162827 [Clavulina sp. PMI_390]